MDRSPRLVALAHLLLLVPLAAPRAQTGDNVLIIVADDVGVDGIAAYREVANPPPTPHIDALAQRGVLFRNAWANPLCSPTRACMMTGRYSLRTGVGSWIPFSPGLPNAEVTIPEMLDHRGSGYAHAAFGKWHLADLSMPLTAPNDAGWSHFAGFVWGIDDYSSWPRTVDGVTATTTAYATTRIVDDALTWIGRQTGPWVCYLAHVSAHTPLHAPPAHLHTQDLTGLDPATTAGPFYRAMVESMDAEIGRLLAGLGPELARTNVIFIGDNGIAAKSTPLEGGLNVPLIVAGPAVTMPNREVDALVGAVDVFATTLELCGVDPQPAIARLDSVSFAGHLRDPARAPRREFVYAESFTFADPLEFACIRNDRYKLIRFRHRALGVGLDLFHDLLLDPGETADLMLRPLDAQEQVNLQLLIAEFERIRSSAAGFEVRGPGGCAGVAGEPRIEGVGSPVIGSPYDVRLLGAAPSAPALLLLGDSATSFAGLPLPFALNAIGGGPGCSLSTSIIYSASAPADPLGEASASVSIPNDRWLVGGRLEHQWLVLDATAPLNALGIVTTRGLSVVIGE